jgi:hypothetical protein
MLEDDLEMMEVVGNIFNSGWIFGSGRWLQNLKQSNTMFGLRESRRKERGRRERLNNILLFIVCLQ